jgi:CBS domain-containing protein
MGRRREIGKLQEVVRELKVGDVMTREVITVHPRALLGHLRDVLRVNRISGVPVVDAGVLVGIVSLEDFIRALADREEDCAIEEKMVRQVQTVYEDDPLVFAVEKFERSHVGRLPVVEREGGRLVGIVTKGDVVRGLLRRLEVDYHEEETRRHRASYIFQDIEADETTIIFRYEVEADDFKRAGEGSSRLRRTLSRLGVRPHIVRRLAIASYEAEMNMVIFGSGGMIRVQVRPRRVIIEVEDSGPGIPDIEKAQQPGYSTASDRVRELGFGAGMGLPNMKKMSDEFAIESEVGKGTLVRMTFFTGEGST